VDNSLVQVQHAMKELSAGRPIVLTDDSDAHLLLAAEKATIATAAFLVRHGSGMVFAALTGADCDRLGLPPMVGVDREYAGTEYTVSVDAIENVTTGISASDRAQTLRMLAARSSTSKSFTRPGHVIPARARTAGVLAYHGPAEATVDLVAGAGLLGVGAFTALVAPLEQTRIATTDESIAFASEHDLAWVSFQDVVRYRNQNQITDANLVLQRTS